MARKQQRNLGYLFLMAGVALLALTFYFRNKKQENMVKLLSTGTKPSKADIQKLVYEEAISLIAGVIFVAMGVHTLMK